MQKTTLLMSVMFLCLFLVGCSTPNPGKTLEEIQKSANNGIEKWADSVKDLSNGAIDTATDKLWWAGKAIGVVAGEKAKEIINEKIDDGANSLKGIASGAVGTIWDTINKANDSVKTTLDTAKETANKAVDQAKTVVVGGYTSYSAPAVDAALKAGKNVILFFHASWCPSCKALDQDILANKAKIPTNTLIFKVDYDLNTSLKTKYGVTAQHTLVSLNSDGSKKSLNRGSINLDAVLKNQ